MATWYGMSRSNYFRVKDEAQFRTWAKNLHLEVFTDSNGRLGFCSDTEDGGFPSWRFKQGAEEDEAIDLPDELAGHLADGEIAVLMSAGHEKACYVSGYATAVNSTGQRFSLVLSDIYEKAAEAFGVHLSSISEAKY